MGRMKKNCKIFQVLFLCLLMISAPVNTYALSSSDLDMFSQNNIMFYDPDSDVENCPSVPNGLYKGVQYSLTDEEMASFARAAANENGSCGVAGVKAELSIMANLYEKKGNGQGIVEYIREGKWFSKGTVNKFDDTSITPSEEYVKAVREVLVEGIRTIPKEIDEHDCVGDIEWLELDGVRHTASNPGSCKGSGLTDASLYVSGKTKIHNVYGATYTFYQWAGGSKTEKCGDPFGYTGDAPSESYSTVAGDATNYAGDVIWTANQLQTISNLMPIYKKAADKYGIPWQLLAVFHGMENSLQLNNPDNGQGVYMLYSYTRLNNTSALDPAKAFLPAGKIDNNEFLRQSEIAAEQIKMLIDAQLPNKDLTDSNNIKRLFSCYNGCSYEGSRYYEKAIQLGFSKEQALNGEGSPYVMNRYDAKRDPNSEEVSPYWRGRFIKDGVYSDDPNLWYTYQSGFGAFLYYEALTGKSYCSTTGNAIADAAIKLAWSVEEWSKRDGYGGCKTDWSVALPNCEPKKSYREAMIEVNTFMRGNDEATQGASCDQFVGTSVRYSGTDDKFPPFNSGSNSYPISPSSQRYHLMNSGLYQKMNINSIDDLRPGDIFITGYGIDYHILMYVGVLDGKETMAEASYGGYTGRLTNTNSILANLRSNGSVVDSSSRRYDVYRRLGGV